MDRIALIGYRGSGKSTVGPLLAAKLGWRFMDSDVVLEQAAGKSIARIFADDGETTFRNYEQLNLDVLLAQKQLVLATGGGIVLRARNRRRLRANAFVVWLDSDPHTCWQRIVNDPTSASRRPNLAGGGLAEVEYLLGVRRPFYKATSHLREDGAESPEVIADRILQAWHSRRTPA